MSSHSEALQALPPYFAKIIGPYELRTYWFVRIESNLLTVRPNAQQEARAPYDRSLKDATTRRTVPMPHAVTLQTDDYSTVVHRVLGTHPVGTQR